jgi:hypothetical protein
MIPSGTGWEATRVWIPRPQENFLIVYLIVPVSVGERCRRTLEQIRSVARRLNPPSPIAGHLEKSGTGQEKGRSKQEVEHVRTDSSRIRGHVRRPRWLVSEAEQHRQAGSSGRMGVPEGRDSSGTLSFGEDAVSGRRSPAGRMSNLRASSHTPTAKGGAKRTEHPSESAMRRDRPWSVKCRVVLSSRAGSDFRVLGQSVDVRRSPAPPSGTVQSTPWQRPRERRGRQTSAGTSSRSRAIRTGCTILPRPADFPTGLACRFRLPFPNLTHTEKSGDRNRKRRIEPGGASCSD